MTQWTIQSLTAPTKFEGLGQLKNTVLPVDTRVLMSGEKILAIPGVSGGQSTSLSPKTNQFILEVASFDAQEVARNSFRINYRSEASKIFAESPSQDLTMSLVVRMSQELGGDYNWNLINRFQNIDTATQKPNTIKVDLEYLSNKLDNQGIAHWSAIIEAKLNFLGKYDSQTKILTFNRFYQSISSQDNILCEIIRMIGLGSLAPQALELSANGYYNKQYDNLNLIRNCITKFGLDEVITRPFVQAASMLDTKNSIQLLNPYSELEPYIRDNLATSLLSIYQKNLVKGEKQPKIFEINQTYNLVDNQPKCTIELSAVWDSSNPYFGTSLVQALSKLIDGGNYELKPLTIPKLGTGYNYQYSNCSIQLIQVTNKLKKQFELPLSRSIWLMQVSLNGIENWNINSYRNYKDTSDYPVLSRDYSLIVPNTLGYCDLTASLSALHSDKQLKVVGNERFSISETMDKLNISIQITDYKTTPSIRDLDSVEDLLKQYQK